MVHHQNIIILVMLYNHINFLQIINIDPYYLLKHILMNLWNIYMQILIMDKIHVGHHFHNTFHHHNQV